MHVACHEANPRDAGRTPSTATAIAPSTAEAGALTDAGAATLASADAGSLTSPQACAPVRPIRAIEVRSTSAKRYADMNHVVLVTSGKKALVTAFFDYVLPCDNSGCKAVEISGAWLGGDAPAAWHDLPSSHTGISPNVTTVPIVRRGELLALTQGQHGYATMDLKQSPNELWLVDAAMKPVTKLSSRDFTADAWAATNDGTLIAGTGAEHPWTDVYTGTPAANAVRVIAIDDDTKLAEQLVHRTAEAPQGQQVMRRPHSPAIAAGTTRAAVAYRVADEAWVAEIDRRTGRRLSPPRRFARGDLGQPALAFDRDELHALWATRSGATKPYTIAHARFGKGIDADPEVEAAVERAESAIAPSFAIGSGRWVVAWMEGDLSRRGRVHLGSSAASLADAVAHAQPFSEPGINARDPKVALGSTAGSGGWLVWSEFAPPVTSLRYAPLVSCPDR